MEMSSVTDCRFPEGERRVRAAQLECNKNESPPSIYLPRKSRMTDCPTLVECLDRKLVVGPCHLDIFTSAARSVRRKTNLTLRTVAVSWVCNRLGRLGRLGLHRLPRHCPRSTRGPPTTLGRGRLFWCLPRFG